MIETIGITTIAAAASIIALILLKKEIKNFLQDHWYNNFKKTERFLHLDTIKDRISALENDVCDLRNNSCGCECHYER